MRSMKDTLKAGLCNFMRPSFSASIAFLKKNVRQVNDSMISTLILLSHPVLFLFLSVPSRQAFTDTNEISNFNIDLLKKHKFLQ